MEDLKHFFLCGFHLGKQSIDYDAFLKMDASQLAWAHFSMGHPDTEKYLREKSNIDPYILDAMLSPETRPRYLQSNDTGSLIIVRAINQSADYDFEDMISVRIWVDAKRVITVVKKHFASANELMNQLNQGSGPKTTAEVVTALLKRILSHVEPVIGALDERTEDWEEDVVKGNIDCFFEALSDMKRKVLVLRRHIAPERDVLVQLMHAKMPFFTKTDLRQLAESHERVQLYVEDLDVIKDRISNITDELRGKIASHTNRAMYMFSLVAVIFLPLTFLTGLFGINVGGIPGSESSVAFPIFSGIMLSIAFGLIWFFRKIKWF